MSLLVFSDLLLLQDVIRAPLFAEHGYSVYVRQLRDADMRETLKALDKKGVKNYIAHLDTQRTLKLLKAVSDDVTYVTSASCSISNGLQCAHIGFCRHHQSP